MDIPIKPKGPKGRPPRKRTATEDRQAAALAKIAKNFKRVHVHQRQRGPQFLAVLLAFLGAALVLYKIFGPNLLQEESLDLDAMTQEPGASQNSYSGPIDSLRFREGIEAFEAPLLGEASSTSFEELAERILRSGRGLSSELHLDGANPSSLQAAQALDTSLAELAGHQPPRLEDLETLRKAWLKLRRQSFAGAEFFLAPAGSLGEDRLVLAAYRNQIDSLDSSLSDAFSRVGVLAGDPEPGEKPEDRQRQREAIEEVARDLRQQLAELKKELPPRPTGQLTPELMVAIQSLEQALTQARNLAGNTNSLTPAGRASYAPVLELINRCRTSLDTLER